MAKYPLSRRQFIHLGSGALAATTVGKTILQPRILSASGRPVAPSDTVRFASIGTGVRGCEHLQASLEVPGIQCVAVCDLYDGRHIAAQEAVNNPASLPPATIAPFSIAKTSTLSSSLAPTTSTVAWQWTRAQQAKTSTAKSRFRIPWTTASPWSPPRKNTTASCKWVASVSVRFCTRRPARFTRQANWAWSCCIQAYWDRNSASGAWVYPIPPGVNDQNIDWTAFQNGAPSIPFDPVRFFRWRCYTDYGEGLGGDLFVHLISGIMFITGTNTAPTRAQSTGGLYRWKDGRQFPDFIETYYDYPELQGRCALQSEQ